MYSEAQRVCSRLLHICWPVSKRRATRKLARAQISAPLYSRPHILIFTRLPSPSSSCDRARRAHTDAPELILVDPSKVRTKVNAPSSTSFSNAALQELNDMRYDRQRTKVRLLEVARPPLSLSAHRPVGQNVTAPPPSGERLAHQDILQGLDPLTAFLQRFPLGTYSRALRQGELTGISYPYLDAASKVSSFFLLVPASANPKTACRKAPHAS